VDLSDRDVAELELGRHARVRLDAAPDDALDGTVSQIAPSASAGSGTFQVEVRLEAPPGRAPASGLTAKVEIDRSLPCGAVVPLAALRPGDGDAALVVAVAGGRAHLVPVRPLFFEDDAVALAEPLDGVVAVATSGASALAEGTPVALVTP
jgi:multidrug efflux pump subunit AcrA (membrane-fusion protein)